MPLPPAAPVDPLLAQADELYARHKAALQEQSDAYKPPDRKGMEEMYQKHAASGDDQMLLAMAAQQAGEGFKPMQAQFLKQAAAAREPMKMAGGTMTPQGFIEDPGYQTELAARRSDAKVKSIEAALQQNLTAQERRRLEIAQQAEKQRHDQVLLALGQIRAGAAGGGTSAGEARNWRTEDTLSKQFDGQVKDYVTEIDATKKLGQLRPNERPNAVEQQSMVILLNKFLDPTSVVREGEFNRVIAAQGILPRVSNYLDRVLKGEPLSDQMIADIRGMGKMYETAASAKIQMIGDEYAAKANRRGLDPTSVVVNPYYRHTETAAPQSGARGGPAAPPPPPKVGEKRGGFTFKGGDPANPASWSK